MYKVESGIPDGWSIKKDSFVSGIIHVTTPDGRACSVAAGDISRSRVLYDLAEALLGINACGKTDGSTECNNSRCNICTHYLGVYLIPSQVEIAEIIQGSTGCSDTDSLHAASAVVTRLKQKTTPPLITESSAVEHKNWMNGCTEPCDAPNGEGPCCCGAWHEKKTT